MAGLNFQTQTIINSKFDKDSNNAVLFEAPENVKVDGVVKDVLKVKRDFLFVKDNVKAIRKAAGYDATMCEAVIDFGALATKLLPSGVTKAYCRLDIYLGVEGAEPFIYSTPWVQKGIPFWVEFTVTANNKANIAQHVADMIKANNLFQIDKDLLKVEVVAPASGSTPTNKLKLTGATEYQRFRNIEISVFDAVSDDAEKVASLKDGDFATDYVFGKNSFGTYSQIVKDLRLPTIENSQWLHIRQAETPIVGAIYNQYIIEYAAPASNEGLACVGQKLESHTTHVFWVKNDAELVTAWETALGKVGTIVDVNAISTAEPVSDLED